MQTSNSLSQGLAKRVSTYDKVQKEKLVTLGQSDKPYKDILTHLQSEIETSTKMANFRHAVTCFKSDGVYQLNQAIEQIYGAANGKQDSKPSGGLANLETVDVIKADGTRIKVPYGKIDLPDLGEGAMIDIGYDNEKNTLMIKGSCQFRFNTMIDEIVDLTRHLLNTDSIYKDQAIELGPDYQPQIMNLSNIDKEFMVLSKKTEYDLRPLNSRVLHAQRCKENGIPLKTGILLEGPYGTGKTLLAFKIAKDAIANGWCFVYLKDPTLLAKTLRLCKTLDNNGFGVIVFLEDVDQVTRGNRDADMQEILNTLDGGDTKQMNVIALFSTNHIELIEPTFLRGKRIGSIVSLGALDSDTALQFLEYTFKEKYTLDLSDSDKVKVGKAIEEAKIVPAFMAEITEKVKANLVFGDTNTVTADDILFSLESYLNQVALAQKKDMSATPEQQLATSLRDVILNGSGKDELTLKKQIEDIHGVTCCD